MCIYVCLAGLGAYTLCNVASCEFCLFLFLMPGFLQLLLHFTGYTYLKVASSPYLTGLIADDLSPFGDVRGLDLEDTGVPCDDIWALRRAGYDVSLYMFLPIF